MIAIAALLAGAMAVLPRRRARPPEGSPAEHMVAQALDDFSWREERLRQLHAHADLAFMRANTREYPTVIGQPR